MTNAQAKKQATYLVSSNKLSPHKHMIIEYLSVAGCLTTNQIKERLGIGLRTLQRYFYDSQTGNGHILDYHRGNAELAEKYGSTFVVAKELKHIRVWTLGTLGQAISKELGYKPISYRGFSIRQLTHDLLCNAVILKLIDKAEAFGYEWKWQGKNESRVIKDRKAVIEPDALLSFTRDGKTSTYCIELHNERGMQRTKEKYTRYRKFFDKNYYNTEWGLETMPTILAYGKYKAIINGYAYAMPYSKSYQMTMYYAGIQSTLKNDKPHRAASINDYKNSGTINRDFDPQEAKVSWYFMLTEPKIKT